MESIDTQIENGLQILDKHEVALKPDKEKLRAFADYLVTMKLPDLSTDEAIAILVEAVKMIADVNQFILKKTK